MVRNLGIYGLNLIHTGCNLFVEYSFSLYLFLVSCVRCVVEEGQRSSRYSELCLVLCIKLAEHE
jgi:hypothetical protein